MVVTAGYWFTHRDPGHDHATDLAGAWSQDFLRENTPCKMALRLEADGNGRLNINYVQQGQRMTWSVPGQWQCTQGRFAFTFTAGSAPPFVAAQRFGGRVINIDEHQLQFKSPVGVESWTRSR